MLECEGYKMFKGIMSITPCDVRFAPYELEGTFLYKPEYDCWYCDGRSYPASVCEVIKERL